MRDKIKLMPIFSPLFAIAYMFKSIFVYLPLWLVGYWWCYGCGKRNGMNDTKFEMPHADICKTCYIKDYGINIVLEEKVHS